MKMVFKHFAVFTALVTAFVACQKEQNVEVENIKGVEISISADGNIPNSKTVAIDGETPSVKWLSTDQLTVYEIIDGSVNQTTTTNSTTLSESDYLANFKATIPGVDPAGSSYKYAAVYPAVAVSRGGTSPDYFYRLTMPDAQTLNGNNFSVDSDIMISEVLDHGSSRVTSSENISFQFKRVGTAVKLTLKGITADEKIKKVVITAPHYIAGRVKYVRETSSLVTDSWHYGSEHQNTITLTVPEITATGTDVLWFRVLAAEKWANGEELSIEVETDKANYYRNGLDGSHAVITLGKDINFVDGGLTAFGVNLASYRVAKPEPIDYTLVESSSNIVDGAEYLIVYTAGPKAMGEFSTSIYSPVDVTITSKVISITSEAVTVVTLEDAGSGKYYMKVADNDYIYSPTTNAAGHDNKTSDDKFKWTVATDKIQNVGTLRYLQYNTGSPRFACYTSGQKDVNLYVNLASILPLGISFDDASYEFVVNSGEYDAFTGQAITKSGGVSDDRAVTYTVDSDEDGIVTSINASTGAIVLSGNTGTATIKATVGATAGVYKAGSVTYTITVTPEPITFVRTTTITSGSKYLLVALKSANYYLAQKVVPSGSNTYGYANQLDVTPLGDGSIQVYSYDDAYTITSMVGGYSIQQSNDKYWSPSSSTYTNITLGDSPVAWAFEKQLGDTWQITSSSKWIQLSSSYTSFGAYSSASGSLPYLYIEDDGSPRLGGTDVAFTSASADIESSTLTTAHLTSVSYTCTAKPDWIDAVTFEGNTMIVESKDNKTLSSRDGVITVKATGSEGSVNADINVTQVASVFEASSTAAMNFAWDDYTNDEIKRVTITSTYPLTDSDAALSGTNAAKFEASITRNGTTDEYYLDVNLVEDNEGESDYTGVVTVSRDGLEISIDLKQAHKGGGKEYYKLVTDISDFSAGKYVVAALKSTTATNKFFFGKASVSSGDWVVESTGLTVAAVDGVRRFEVADLPDDAIEFTFTGDNTAGFTISSGSSYLYYTSASNRKLAFAAAGSSQKWVVNAKSSPLVTGGVYLSAVTTSGNYTISENSTGDGAIRGYANTTSYRAIYIFKKVNE